MSRNSDLYVYTRTDETTQLYVVCNFSEKERSLPVPEEFLWSEVLISNCKDVSPVGKIRPYEAFVLKRSLQGT